MSNRGFGEEFDRAAGGLDLDEDPIREGAHRIGMTMATEGPEAIIGQIEELLPEAWREHIASFPLTAVAVGIGVGIFLGRNKGDELIAAASTMISAAATANLAKVFGEQS